MSSASCKQEREIKIAIAFTCSLTSTRGLRAIVIATQAKKSAVGVIKYKIGRREMIYM